MPDRDRVIEHLEQVLADPHHPILPLTDEEKKNLTPEIRAVVHLIRNEFQGIRSRVDLTDLKTSLLREELAKHNVECLAYKKEISDFLNFFKTLKTTKTLGNTARNALVWFAGGAFAANQLYQLIKTFFS